MNNAKIAKNPIHINEHPITKNIRIIAKGMSGNTKQAVTNPTNAINGFIFLPTSLNRAVVGLDCYGT